MADDFIASCHDCGCETYGFDYHEPDWPEPDRPRTGFLCADCSTAETVEHTRNTFSNDSEPEVINDTDAQA